MITDEQVYALQVRLNMVELLLCAKTEKPHRSVSMCAAIALSVRHRAKTRLSEGITVIICLTKETFEANWIADNKLIGFCIAKDTNELNKIFDEYRFSAELINTKERIWTPA